MQDQCLSTSPPNDIFGHEFLCGNNASICGLYNTNTSRSSSSNMLSSGFHPLKNMQTINMLSYCLNYIFLLCSILKSYKASKCGLCPVLNVHRPLALYYESSRFDIKSVLFCCVDYCVDHWCLALVFK